MVMGTYKTFSFKMFHRVVECNQDIGLKCYVYSQQLYSYPIWQDFYLTNDLFWKSV